MVKIECWHFLTFPKYGWDLFKPIQWIPKISSLGGTNNLFCSCKIAPSCDSFLNLIQLCALNSIVQNILYIYSMHCILFIVLCALYSMHCFLCVTCHAFYSMQYILCIVLYAVYSMHYILCIVYNALYSLDCILCIAFHELYSMHCIICVVFYAL